MDKEEKLRKLRKWLEEHGLTQQDVADRLGISAPYVNALLTGKREFGKKMAAKWYNHFGLLPPYLMLGEGPMTAADEQQPADSPTGNPYFDIASLRGGFPASDQYALLPWQAAGTMSIPGVPVSADIPFLQVSGNSMLDRDDPQRSIPDGSWVAVQRVTIGTFRWGETYALMTDDGAIVKRIYQSDREECVRCVSNNPDYPPFDLLTANIRGDIYKVIARVIINLY